MTGNEYRIDFELITPSGEQWHTTSSMTSNGLPIRSLEYAKKQCYDVTSRYLAEGYKVVSSKLMSRTITYTDWEEEKGE